MVNFDKKVKTVVMLNISRQSPLIMYVRGTPHVLMLHAILVKRLLDRLVAAWSLDRCQIQWTKYGDAKSHVVPLNWWCLL